MRACSLILTADIRFACATQVFRWFERPIWKPKSTFSSHFWCTLWWSCLSYKNVVLESTCCVLGPKLCLVSQRIKHNISEYLMQKFEVTNLFFFFDWGCGLACILTVSNIWSSRPFGRAFSVKWVLCFFDEFFGELSGGSRGNFDLCVCVCVCGGGVLHQNVSPGTTPKMFGDEEVIFMHCIENW